MEFDSVVRRRKSVREYISKKTDWRDTMDVIEAALQGPFAENINNLKFLIVEEKETITKIAKSAEQSWIANASSLILVCSDDSHLENIYGERGRIYSRQQAGAAVQSMLLKAVDLGLASCWIGAYSDEIIKETLSIPQHIQIEAIIPLGYENKKLLQKKPDKKELESVIFWESWKNLNRPPLFKEPKDPLSLE